MDQRRGSQDDGPKGHAPKRDGAGPAAARGARVRPAADPRLSRSLEYGMAMLQCFSGEDPALGIAQLAKAIGIGRSTTHRYATTLLMLGYLEQDGKRKYRLAAGAADSGMAAIGTIRRLAPARQILEDLRDWTGHTVGMGVLDGTRALYVQRLRAHRRGQYGADLEVGVGAPLPLHCTAIGKALMAMLPDERLDDLAGRLDLARHGPNSIGSRRKLLAELAGIRERGIALSDQELAAGVGAIAAPVGQVGRWTVALDVTVPSSSHTPERLLEAVGPLLQRAAQRVSQAAGAAADQW
jgi:IclR family pca regulon transcriptional regulator